MCTIYTEPIEMYQDTNYVLSPQSDLDFLADVCAVASKELLTDDATNADCSYNINNIIAVYTIPFDLNETDMFCFEIYKKIMSTSMFS